MVRHFACWLIGVVVSATLAACGGCSAVGENGKSLFPTFATTESRAVEEESHRLRFQEAREPADFRWLLSQRIQSGMSPVEVGKVFGENGQHQAKDGWLKKHDTNYRVGDVSYKWGPDNLGNSALLVFRDEKLLNFDPNEFAEPK